jgi:hypothetical protein
MPSLARQEVLQAGAGSLAGSQPPHLGAVLRRTQKAGLLLPAFFMPAGRFSITPFTGSWVKAAHLVSSYRSCRAHRVRSLRRDNGVNMWATREHSVKADRELISDDASSLWEGMWRMVHYAQEAATLMNARIGGTPEALHLRDRGGAGGT